MKDLYIVGAGGFGREVLWLVERINNLEKTWNFKGFIDDNKRLHGSNQGGYEVIDGCEYFDKITHDVWVVCAVGSAKVKKKIVEELVKKKHVRFATLIDPSVIISKRVEIGEGSIICAGTIITVDIKIGKYVIVNINSTVGHDVRVKDYVTVYPSTNISGNVFVGETVEIGTGVQIIQGKKIGNYSIIGAGAVVVNDIPEMSTAVGCPAKPIKYFNE